MVAILSFDLEEYFDVELAQSVPRHLLGAIPSRVSYQVNRLLDLLLRYDVSATFFVLGSLAKERPELIRLIHDAGFEIALHGYFHKRLDSAYVSRKLLKQQIRDARHILEDIISSEIIGFRAPGFSVNRSNLWVLDLLVEEGFVYDSSILPARGINRGEPLAPSFFHRAILPSGCSIVELPVLTLSVSIFGYRIKIPFGGGGYARILPSFFYRTLLENLYRRERDFLLYFHPWELDPDQPPLPIGLVGRLRHRIGLSKVEGLLEGLFGGINFKSVRSAFSSLSLRDVYYKDLFPSSG